MSPSVLEPIRVTCAVEGEGYVAHCAAMLRSLLVQHPDDSVRIEYLHGEDTSERGRTQLRAMVEGLGAEIAFHSVPEQWLEHLPTRDFTRKATWYRIFLPDLLPHAPRVLHLDADLLVTDSLLELWTTPLEGNLVGAVGNVVLERDLQRHRNFGLPRKESYFNAGVLLMDLERMREERTTERLRRYAETNAQSLGWRDQDALNFVLHERRLPLHPRWNCTNAIMNFPWAADYFGTQAVDEARSNPAIRHFEGPALNKPWHLLCDPELRKLYIEHRRHTPWPHVRAVGRTPPNLIRYARGRARRIVRR